MSLKQELFRSLSSKSVGRSGAASSGAGSDKCVLTCPTGHVLSGSTVTLGPEEERVCDSCGHVVEPKSRVQSCSRCSYDVCSYCTSGATRPAAPHAAQEYEDVEENEEEEEEDAEEEESEDEGSSACEEAAEQGTSAATHCPKGHTLVSIVAPTGQDDERVCDGCGHGIQESARCSSCRRCGYDLCEYCVDGVPLPVQKPMAMDVEECEEEESEDDEEDASEVEASDAPHTRCPRGHALVQSTAPSSLEAEHVCDGCGHGVEPGSRMDSCKPCPYDLCGFCATGVPRPVSKAIAVEDSEVEEEMDSDGSDNEVSDNESSEVLASDLHTQCPKGHPLSSVALAASNQDEHVCDGCGRCAESRMATCNRCSYDLCEYCADGVPRPVHVTVSQDDVDEEESESEASSTTADMADSIPGEAFQNTCPRGHELKVVLEEESDEAERVCDKCSHDIWGGYLTCSRCGYDMCEGCGAEAIPSPMKCTSMLEVADVSSFKKGPQPRAGKRSAPEMESGTLKECFQRSMKRARRAGRA